MRDSIASYLNEINDVAFLPGLQREFVWSPKQIEELFDSLVRNYPVGLIIKWNIRHTDREHVSYEFIRDFVAEEGTVPEAVYDAGFRRYNRQSDEDRYDTLVIDGQQRLNSILIGLGGSIARYNGGSGKPKSEAEYWERRMLCIDLFGHPHYDEPYLPGEYDFRFRRAEGFGKASAFGYEERGGNRHFWYPLPDTLDEADRKRPIREVRTEVKDRVAAAEFEASGEERELLRDVAVGVVNDVFDNVVEYSLPSREVTHPTEHIKEIFQRINTEGSDPKPYQLLLSRLMSYWPYLDDSEPLNARNLVENWIERYQADYPGYERQLNRRLFMIYACYLLGTDLAGLRTVNEFDDADLDRLHTLWRGEDARSYNEFSRFEGGLERSLETLTQIGFSGRTMDGLSYIALLAKFYYENDAPLNRENRNEIFRFFAKLLLLSESHGTMRRTKARQMLAELEEQEESLTTFPGDELFSTLNIQPAPEDIRRTVTEARYEKTDGSALFSDDSVAAILGLIDEAYSFRDIKQMHVDHIYPRSRADEFVPEEAEEGSIDRLGNLQLLNEQENVRKSDRAPTDWLDDLGELEREKLERVNLYPDVVPTDDAFADFVAAREQRIIDHLTDKLVLSAGSND